MSSQNCSWQILATLHISGYYNQRFFFSFSLQNIQFDNFNRLSSSIGSNRSDQDEWSWKLLCLLFFDQIVQAYFQSNLLPSEHPINWVLWECNNLHLVYLTQSLTIFPTKGSKWISFRLFTLSLVPPTDFQATVVGNKLNQYIASDKTCLIVFVADLA